MYAKLSKCLEANLPHTLKHPVLSHFVNTHSNPFCVIQKISCNSKSHSLKINIVKAIISGRV